MSLLFSASLVAACGGSGGGNAGDTDGGTDTASGGTDSGGTASGGTDSGGTDSGGDLDVIPFPGGMRRLLAHEYAKSVGLMLGPEAEAAAAGPTDIAQEGFDAVGASILSLPSTAVESYEGSAIAVADAAIANPSTLGGWVPCATDGSELDSCYGEIANVLGRIAFRRDVTMDENARLRDIGIAGRTWDDGNFMTGVKYELMAILQSPSFLHQVEVGVADPDSGYRRLTGLELVSRMAFTLLGRTPTPDELNMGESGDLETTDGILAAANAMLASPDASAKVDQFFNELLRLRFVPGTPKDATLFPTWSSDLGEDMRTESLMLVRDVVWDQDVDFRTLFTTDYTYVNDALAANYSIPAPGTGDMFVKAQWPPNQGRAGYLSQGSFLTFQSGPLRNSPTKRGRYVQRTILCVDVPPPPGGVDVNLPEPTPGQTLRELLEQHMEEPACAGCHALMDPVGFAFEGFNAIGGYRPTENGSMVDMSGAVTGLGEWQNAQELGALIAADPRTASCLVKNLWKGHLGNVPTPDQDDGFVLADLAFEDDEFRLRQFLSTMVTTDLFRLVDEPK